jgi:hypothetical protein
MSTSHDAHDVQLADAVLSSSGKSCPESALYQSVALPVQYFDNRRFAETSCSLVYSSVVGDGIRILHSTVGRVACMPVETMLHRQLALSRLIGAMAISCDAVNLSA